MHLQHRANLNPYFSHQIGTPAMVGGGIGGGAKIDDSDRPNGSEATALFLP